MYIKVQQKKKETGTSPIFLDKDEFYFKMKGRLNALKGLLRL
jgi:hypothetical protein